MTLTVCWRAQRALTCAPGEAHLLPAGHPLKWLGTRLQPAAPAAAALHSQLALQAALAADDPGEASLPHEEDVGGEAPLVLLSVTRV